SERASYDLAERSVRIRNAHLPVNNGEMWYLYVRDAKVLFDTTGARSGTLYAGAGAMTSCEDAIPHYRLDDHAAKPTVGNTIVARPAILYIKDVPVMWLPFIFSDTHGGRHSGILVPQFGIGDIVRNSPTYRRNIDHAGYYWAISDYMDFATW